MIHEMKIKIKDKEVELKYSIRALMMFENIMNKTFSIDNTQDSVVFFYCIVLASDKALKISFDEFLDILDEQPNVISDFAEWITKTNSVNTLLEEDVEVDGGNEPKK